MGGREKRATSCKGPKGILFSTKRRHEEIIPSHIDSAVGGGTASGKGNQVSLSQDQSNTESFHGVFREQNTKIRRARGLYLKTGGESLTAQRNESPGSEKGTIGIDAKLSKKKLNSS